jgi:lysophospholipase L1-like esterase
MSYPIDEKEGPGPARGRRLGRIAAIAAVALTLTACSTALRATSTSTGAGTSPGAAAPMAADVLHGSYVALGDSYTAGPGIPDQTGAVAGCEQSSSSYPFLVAQRLRLELTDMSCSSATIADLSAAQSTGDGINPAQLSALSPATALVTLGIGGNDVGWASIVTRCAELDLIPVLIPGESTSDLTPCRDYYFRDGTDPIRQRIQMVSRQLATALGQIKARARRARVYVVGYPDLFPASGDGCADTLGITSGDVAFLNREEQRLNDELDRAAQAAGDGYVDAYTPSEGHDACAAPASRWIEPLIPDAAAAPLHPNAAGQQGMARAIVAAVKGRLRSRPALLRAGPPR